MKLNELYIAPEAEVISFRAAEHLAWQELEGDYVSNPIEPTEDEF